MSGVLDGTPTITQAEVFQDTENATLLVRSNGIGSGTVTVTAIDSAGNRSSQTFNVESRADRNNSQTFLSDIPDFTASPGSSFQFQLEANDIEGDDHFFFVDATTPSDVVATVDENGLVTVDLPASDEGTEIFVDVAVSESSNRFTANRDEQRVKITLELSEAVADTFTVDEDSADNALDVLANDGLDSQAVITGVSVGNLTGTVTIANDAKSLQYTPAADFVGTETFTYTVLANGQSFQGQVAVETQNVIDGPTAHDDVFPDLFTNQGDRDLLIEDSPGVILAVLTNDRPDPGQDEIVLIEEVGQPSFGTVEFNPFNITYTPNPDFVGTDTFTYTIEGFVSELRSTGTVTVHVPELNDPPTAGDDAFAVAFESGTQTFAMSDVLTNDSAGPDNESHQVLTITDVTYTGNGTVTLTDSGDIQYAAASGFSGSETISYTVTDDGTDRGVSAPQSATGTITVTVDEPTFVRADTFNLDFGLGETSLAVLDNDESTGLSITQVSAATRGTVTISQDSQTVLFTPADGFTGTDVFVYTARDAGGEEGTATVTVHVDTQPPVANDDAYTVTGDTTLAVLDNDVQGVGSTELAVDQVTQPTNGQAVILFAGTGIDYQPNDGFVGNDSFTYTVLDDTGKTATATVLVTVEEPPNNPPLAFNDDVTVATNGMDVLLNVLNNDTALPDVGETLTIELIVTSPQNGTARITAAGDNIEYTPDTDFEGTDTLTYRISDGNGGTATASVGITVEPDNVPPIAVDDLFTIDSLGEQFFSLLVNDTFEEGELFRILSLDTSNTRGGVRISDDGSQVIYTPDFGNFGEDVFLYTVDDGTGLVSQGQVRVDVPDLLADSYFSGSVYTDLNGDGRQQTGERGLGGVEVLLEGTDLNGTPVRMSMQTDLHGAFRFDRVAPGDYAVTQVQPDFVANGQALMAGTPVAGDTLSFSVGNSLISADANAFAESGLSPRFAVFNTLSSARTPGLFAVLENDRLAWVETNGGWDDIQSLDVSMEGDTLLLQAMDHGGLTLGARLPASGSAAMKVLGHSGDHTFVRITGNSADVLSEGAVDDLFSAPTARNDSYSLTENAPLDVDAVLGVLGNDSDPDGDALFANVVVEPQHGTLTLSEDGSFRYVPDTDFTGEDSFRYRANDGTHASGAATVTLRVEAEQSQNALFGPVTTGSFEDDGLLGIRTDLVAGAPAITANHVDGDVDYSAHSNPPTYGDHHGFDPNDLDLNPGITPRPTGVYTEEQPDEDLVHNLEHGHVWISYNPVLISDADLEALEQLVRDGSTQAGGGGVGVILTPRSDNDRTISLASWARLLHLDAYDAETIRNFVETNRGKAPEGFITP